MSSPGFTYTIADFSPDTIQYINSSIFLSMAFHQRIILFIPRTQIFSESSDCSFNCYLTGISLWVVFVLSADLSRRQFMHQVLQSAEFGHNANEALQQFFRTVPPLCISNLYESWVLWRSLVQHLCVIAFVYILDILHHVLCCFYISMKGYINFIWNYTSINEKPC